MGDCTLAGHFVGVKANGTNVNRDDSLTIPQLDERDEASDLHGISDDNNQFSCYSMAPISISESSSCSSKFTDPATMCLPGLHAQRIWVTQKFGDSDYMEHSEDAGDATLFKNIESKECSMCGDVGIPECLFKCIRCQSRYQHMYCSRSYPHNVVVKCNWCLHREDMDTTKQTLGTIVTGCSQDQGINTPPLPGNHAKMAAEMSCPITDDHGKAFQYLLQIAATGMNDTNANNIGITPMVRESGIIVSPSAAPKVVKHADAKKARRPLSRWQDGRRTYIQVAAKEDQHALFEAQGESSKASDIAQIILVAEERDAKRQKRYRALTASEDANVQTRRSQLRGDGAKDNVPLGTSSAIERKCAPTPAKSHIRNRKYKLLTDVLC